MVKFIFTAGPLGSGKTTFINAIAPGLEKIARLGAAISDLGIINDDSRRIKIKGDVKSFKAGCVCCERKQDLKKHLEKIDNNLDYFIIEPSGASNIYDIIQTVQEIAISKREDFEIDKVFSMVPVSNWEEVKSLRAQIAAAQCASTIILTKPNEKIEEVKKDLDALGATKSRVVYAGEKNKDLSYLLFYSPQWRESLTNIESGHEHFRKISFSLPPFIDKDKVYDLLQKLSNAGVKRAKGVVPYSRFEFDLAYGEINTSEYVGNQVAARGTAIFGQDINTNNIIKIINSLEMENVSDLEHTLKDSSLEDLLKNFHYHFSFSRFTREEVNGRIRANFEGTDDAYTIAKEIYLKTKCQESSPLELALVPYLEIRIKGLEKLRKSNQEDKNYVGVMLGSYAIQMLGEKDGISFNNFIEEKLLEVIKEKVIPDYFFYLSNFNKNDLKYFLENDKHFNFFVWMAERSKPFVRDRKILYSSSFNMRKIFSFDSSLSKRWENIAYE